MYLVKKVQPHCNFASAPFMLNVQYVPANQDMTGNPVECLVKQFEVFKIAALQTTLQLPADSANSY